MRKFFNYIFEILAEKTRKKEPQIAILEKIKRENEQESVVDKELPVENSEEFKEEEEIQPEPKKIKKNILKKKTEIISYKRNPGRDLMEMMEIPFLALSKNRKNPIIYESPDGTRKVKVTRHTGHFLASIYDWDIILFVASKMQEILNSGIDIPPRTMVVPRHEILTALHKHNVNTQQKELEKSLHRLKRTAIDTTIRNEDYRYKSDFGFLDSWEYTERKDIKEIKITLSQWLYDGICAQGSLLKVDQGYFELTSALKRFLYRTARKHVGTSEKSWEFSIEKLYQKSGSERELRKFKSDLKIAVIANDIPGYTMEWNKKNKKSFVSFSKLSKIDQVENFLERIESKIGKNDLENKASNVDC